MIIVGLCPDQPVLTLPEFYTTSSSEALSVETFLFPDRLARRLGMSPARVGYAVQRGEAIAHENGYQLT
jgi:hypothetical protein